MELSYQPKAITLSFKEGKPVTYKAQQVTYPTIKSKDLLANAIRLRGTRGGLIRYFSKLQKRLSQHVTTPSVFVSTCAPKCYLLFGIARYWKIF